MIISFSHTTPSFLSGQKTVTRRRWAKRTFDQWVSAWREGRLIHDAYDKSPRYGGKKVGVFLLTERPYSERLGDFPPSDLLAEGGFWATVNDYIGYQGGNPQEIITVIRFIRLDQTETP
jgi:hypothetical protein